MGPIWAYVRALGPTLGPMLPCGGHAEAIDGILGAISESFWRAFRAILASISGLGFRTRFWKDLGHLLIRFGARSCFKNATKTCRGLLNFMVFDLLLQLGFGTRFESVLEPFWSAKSTPNRT